MGYVKNESGIKYYERETDKPKDWVDNVVMYRNNAGYVEEIKVEDDTEEEGEKDVENN